jgi:hypothetical protein
MSDSPFGLGELDGLEDEAVAALQVHAGPAAVGADGEYPVGRGRAPARAAADTSGFDDDVQLRTVRHGPVGDRDERLVERGPADVQEGAGPYARAAYGATRRPAFDRPQDGSGDPQFVHRVHMLLIFWYLLRSGIDLRTITTTVVTVAPMNRRFSIASPF